MKWYLGQSGGFLSVSPLVPFLLPLYSSLPALPPYSNSLSLPLYQKVNAFLLLFFFLSGSLLFLLLLWFLLFFLLPLLTFAYFSLFSFILISLFLSSSCYFCTLDSEIFFRTPSLSPSYSSPPILWKKSARQDVLYRRGKEKKDNWEGKGEESQWEMYTWIRILCCSSSDHCKHRWMVRVNYALAGVHTRPFARALREQGDKLCYSRGVFEPLPFTHCTCPRIDRKTMKNHLIKKNKTKDGK